MKVRMINACLLLTALLWAPGLNAQEPKPTPTEGQPAETPAKPEAKPAAKGVPAASKDKAKPKGSSLAAKQPKAAQKPSSPPPNYMVGETAPPPSKKPALKPRPAPSTKRRSRSAKPTGGPRIDINTATKEELMKLPGVFEAEAAKIIAARPYKSKAGLLVDAGLTGAQYFNIKDRVFAGGAQPPKK